MYSTVHTELYSLCVSVAELLLNMALTAYSTMAQYLSTHMEQIRIISVKFNMVFKPYCTLLHSTDFKYLNQNYKYKIFTLWSFMHTLAQECCTVYRTYMYYNAISTLNVHRTCNYCARRVSHSEEPRPWGYFKPYTDVLWRLET